jgi:2,4-dienoyl-CoA reductase-like NADH-dependent reductase (Old Yellow Enzyme family)/thioredoxin reductase
MEGYIMKKYKRLFSPGKINSLTLRNRIIMPTMGTYMPHLSGETSDKLIEMFARRARGGAAMLITENFFVDIFPEDLESIRKPHHSPLAAHNPKLYEWVEAVQVHGCRMCMSMNPTPQRWIVREMKLGTDKMDDTEIAAYQGLGLFNKITTGEIEKIIAEFARVAGRVKKVGFDAIEINFAFFPDYFTLEIFNKRTDKYGGDLDGRLNFIKELVQATRTEVGKGFPLMMIIDADQFLNGWRTIEETKVIAKKLEEWGIDVIRCRGGTSITMEYDCITQYLPNGAIAHLAAEVKKVVDIPVTANGKLGDPDVAEKILEDGDADFISMGRPLLADPDLPNKIRTGQADRVRKCVSCNIGCLGNLLLDPGRPLRCTVNPVLGNEEKFNEIGTAPNKKKVVIVGAGPAGMSAALTAVRRGHDVVLFEKTGELGGGGHFKQACIPPFKQENLYITEYYEREFKELDNITIHLNSEAYLEKVMGENPDAVIIATGGRALIPDLPGVDSPNVISYEDALLERKAMGKHVVIVGGGSVGCEVASFLGSKGKSVTILEMLTKLASTVNHATRNSLMGELTKYGTETITGAQVKSISENKVNYIKDGKEVTVKCDTIVLAMGAISETKLYDDLRDLFLTVPIIGDASEPRMIMHAVREGFYTAYYL